MKRAGWWLLCAALWTASASAQPVIVDPNGNPDDDTKWHLQLEQVDLGGATLDTPTGMVLLGSRTVQELLVLEKHTGRVRHFREGVEQPIALDLGVDTCGDRGLIDIALHPFFDRSRPQVEIPDPPPNPPPDPPDPDEAPDNVKADWIYLSYHTDDDAGPDDDGCDDGAVFRVERYTWDGIQQRLEDGDVVYEKALTADETTELGGPIALGLDVGNGNRLVASLFIAIGALERDGVLQNNKDAPVVFDDTSVLLRLEDDGETPVDNPFDRGEDEVGEERKYFAYGVRDPRSLAVDPPTQIFATRVWASERSENGDDEIDLLESFDNGGYSTYDGFQGSVPPNLLEDGQVNPAYQLFDLLQGRDRNDVLIPISTYSNPPMTFADPTYGPTGLAFGGVEAGALHLNALFVGSERGELYRFAIDEGRSGMVVGPPLSDRVVNLGVPDNPKTPDDDHVDPDSVAQILVATGFGAISDLATGADGSIYVADQENGVVYRVFTDAVRDLAVASIKVPKKIALSDKRPSVTRAVQVTLVNQGDTPERIIADTGDDPETTDENEGVQSLEANLEALIDLQITPTGGCAPLGPPRVVVPKYAQPPHTPAIGLAPNGGRLTLDFLVDWTCASPSAKGLPDFEASASIDMLALGVVEPPENHGDNVCPRPPVPDPDPAKNDPGCGAKTSTGLGGPIVTDVTRK
jgi:aldose sugar dehydrogenase